MALIQDFTVLEIIEENSFLFYKAVRNKDHLPVLIKSTSLKNSEQVKLLKHEFEIASLLDPSCTIKPISLEQQEDLLTLTYETFKGESLRQYIQRHLPDLKEFLFIAKNISIALSNIHSKGVIHKDIKPENILINPDTYEIKIIDMGIASIIPSEYIQEISNPGLIKGTLPYMSPEQTGRMNRAGDYRTDMYSLGVTFYEMLTGSLPFEAKDPLEWIYCHLAVSPIPLNVVSENIPKVISDIILKLMAKLPEDRYQSMDGLKYDIETCYKQLNEKGNISPFSLGQKDISSQFHLSQKLYGRSNERSKLLKAFDNVVATGVSELIMVSGYSGIGKTAIIKELNKPILHQNGFFISGKFDPFKQTVPYSTIVEVFRTFIMIILSKPEEKLKIWKQNFLEAVGVNGQLIVDVIPQMELIIGKQPPVPELPPIEAQNRFKIVFEKFIRVLSKKERPICIFLDDLQWADIASLKLIQEIISNKENKFILLIGAYRDNEIYPSHPLSLTLQELKNIKAPLYEIKLGPLKIIDIENFIADSFASDIKDSKSLASLVFDKTKGNPFFTIQFLLTLYKENLLKFNRQLAKWTWEIEKIKAKKYTDNVIDLMIEKIKKITTDSLDLLTKAACLGNKFSIRTLALITKNSQKEIIEKMEEVVNEGLVYAYDDSYKFLHDRVQEAAYSLIPNEQKPLVHLEIGRLLLSLLSKEELEEKIFNVTNHLNFGIKYITDSDEIENLFHLNYAAAMKAKSSIAYNSACKYLSKARTLLSKEAFKTHYEEAFLVNIELAESEYLAGHFDKAEILFDLLLKKTKSRRDSAKVFVQRSKFYQATGKYSDSVRVTREALHLFNITFPDSKEEIRNEFIYEVGQVAENMKGRSIEDLVNAPEVTDTDTRVIINIIAEALPTWYSGRPDLFPLLVVKGLNYALKYGNTLVTCRLYQGYAMILISALNNIPSGYTFSEASLELNAKYNNRTLHGLLHMVHGVFINIWRKPISTSDIFLKDAFTACLEVGDFAFAGYTAILTVLHSIEKADNMDKIHEQCQWFINFEKANHNDVVAASVHGLEQFIGCMEGRTYEISKFDDDTFNEAESIEILKKSGLGSALGIFLTMRQAACMIFGKHKESMKYAALIEPMLPEIGAMIAEVNYHYFMALTVTAQINKDKLEDYNKFSDLLNNKLEKLKLWSDNCPENFYHRYALISAEIARIEKRSFDAMHFYDHAITSARQNGFTQYEAIANEVAANFYLDEGFNKISRTYLQEAHSGYMRWGANGKVNQLEKNYPFLKSNKNKSLNTASTLGGVPIVQLDILSMIKSSQIVSSEIVLEHLNEALMRIAIEQAGAQKAYLLIERGNQLTLSAEGKIVDHKIVTKIHEPSKSPESDIFPNNIVQYVQRSQDKVILENGTLINSFSSDPYLSNFHPLSIACLPIVRQHKLKGILYLENDLITGAFTPEKISMLDVLATQAAISIENAMLFKELNQINQELLKTNNDLDDFMYTASHDLKAPIANLEALIGLLDEPEYQVENEQKDLLKKMMSDSVEKLKSTIKELEEISKVQHNLADDIEDLCISDITSKVLDTLKDKINSSDATIKTDFNSVNSIHFSNKNLTTILYNLISNAIKFRIPNTKPNIFIKTYELGKDFLILSVKDNGIGIPIGKRDKLFKMFKRLHTHEEGMGVGLYIIKRIVENTGGRVEIESEEGKGSEFKIFLKNRKET